MSTRNGDILKDTIETLELTIRAARRCAYDYRHCANDVRDKERRKLYLERSDYYVDLFQSGNSCKDYRHKLHQTIDELEMRVDRLRDVLKKAGIADPTEFQFRYVTNCVVQGEESE